LRVLFVFGQRSVVDVDPEAAHREPAGGFSFGSSVLAAQLLFVSPEFLVEAGISHDVVPALRLPVTRQQVLVVIDADEAVFDLQHDPAAHGPVGHHVAVGVEQDLAVPVDLAEGLQRGIVIHRGQRSQVGDLLLPALLDAPVMGAVDAAVGRLGQPAQEVLIGLCYRDEPVAPPEVLPQVIDGALHLVLRPGAVRGTGDGRKAVVMGEVQELGIEDRLARRVAAGHHVLEVVVEALGRDPLQIPEGPDMAIHEALQGAALEKLGIEGPAEAQHQDEGKDRGRSSRGLHELEVGPVELGLPARLRLEAHVGQPRLLLLDRADIVPDDPVGARVAGAPDPLEDPRGPVVVLLQPVPDHRGVGLQDRFPAPGLTVLGEVGTHEMLLDGVAVKAKLPGNRPDAHAVAIQGLDVHVTLLGDDGVSPPLCEETIPRVYPQGGTLFTDIFGTLLH